MCIRDSHCTVVSAKIIKNAESKQQLLNCLVICLIVEVILVFNKYHFLHTIVVGFDESQQLYGNGVVGYDEAVLLYENGVVGCREAAPLGENGGVGLCYAGLWLGF